MDLNASPLPEGDEVIYEERFDKHSVRQELRVRTIETMHQVCYFNVALAVSLYENVRLIIERSMFVGG